MMWLEYWVGDIIGPSWGEVGALWTCWLSISFYNVFTGVQCSVLVLVVYVSQNEQFSINELFVNLFKLICYYFAVSEDESVSNCLQLEDVDVVMTSSSIKTLVDGYSKNDWILPISVKSIPNPSKLNYSNFILLVDRFYTIMRRISPPQWKKSFLVPPNDYYPLQVIEFWWIG